MALHRELNGSGLLRNMIISLHFAQGSNQPGAEMWQNWATMQSSTFNAWTKKRINKADVEKFEKELAAIDTCISDMEKAVDRLTRMHQANVKDF